jgi:DDE domain
MIRQSQYLNNLVEHDHRAIKRRTRPMLGFKTSRRVRNLLGDIAVMPMVIKNDMNASHPRAVEARGKRSLTGQRHRVAALYSGLLQPDTLRPTMKSAGPHLIFGQMLCGCRIRPSAVDQLY